MRRAERDAGRARGTKPMAPPRAGRDQDLPPISWRAPREERDLLVAPDRRCPRGVIVALSLGLILALAAVVAVATVGSDDRGNGAPARLARAGARTPAANFRARLESVDFNLFTLHWLEDFATLAPPGLAVAQQGLLGPAAAASTRESDELNAALAADRGGVYSGTFTVPENGSAKTVTPVISAATATYSAYHSATTAHAAFEAVQQFSTRGRTATANQPIALVPNAATHAFGFRSGPAKEPTFTAVLEFPGVLVQLSTTSANRDQLTGLIAVVTSWARQ